MRYTIADRRALLMTALVGLATAVSMASPASADATLGKHLFTTDCVRCHKADGEGGLKLGTATSADLRAPDLEQQYKTDAAISDAILDGKDEEGKPLDKIMPRWRGKLTDADVTSIIAYLKTLKK